MDTSEIQNSLKYKLGDKIDYLGVFTLDHIINIQINKHRNKVIGFICNTLESTDSAAIMGHWAVTQSVIQSLSHPVTPPS